MHRLRWWVLYLAFWGHGRTANADEIPALEWPTALQGARISQTFGVSAQQPGRAFAPGVRHAGLDIHIRAGSPVYAAEAGIVRRAFGTYLSAGDVGRYTDARNAVVLEHGSADSRFTTSYGHVRFTVKEGQSVRRGEQIGTVADWGGNTHLHFGIRNASFDSNPALAILGRGTREQLAQHIDPWAHFSKHISQDLGQSTSQLFAPSSGNRVRDAERSEVAPPQPTPPRTLSDASPLRLIPEAQAAEPTPAENGLVDNQRFGIRFRAPDGWTARTDPEGVIYSKGQPEWKRFVRIGFQTLPGNSPMDVSNKMYRSTQRKGKTTPYTLTAGGEQLSGAWGQWAGQGVFMEHVIFDRGGRRYMVSTTYTDVKDRQSFLDVVNSVRFLTKTAAP